jgi:hypothetical protein
MTIAETQCLEVHDVAKALVDLSRGIDDAVARLVRVLGELVSPASPDPEELEERRNHEP